MRIRPLTGQVLVIILPDDSEHNGILLPDGASIQEPKEQDPLQRRQWRKGIVREIGPWRRTKNGFGILPPFGIGATVIIPETSGQKLNLESNANMRLVKSDDVIAVLRDE